MVGYSYPTSAANCRDTDWPERPNCRLRIMCATSIPSCVVEAELKPIICLCQLFDEPVVLLNDVVQISDLQDFDQLIAPVQNRQAIHVL